jgi:hypothetical protein
VKLVTRRIDIIDIGLLLMMAVSYQACSVGGEMISAKALLTGGGGALYRRGLEGTAPTVVNGVLGKMVNSRLKSWRGVYAWHVCC